VLLPTLAGVMVLAAPAMPEPLLGESITDIDGERAGELEVDLNGAVPVFGGNSPTWLLGVEAEGRVTRRLGLSAEAEMPTPLSAGAVGVRLGASWTLLHDRPRHFHVQAEATARLLGDDRGGVDTSAALGDSAQPYSAGLRAGLTWGIWTLRAALGAQAGAASAHLLPLRAGFALLASVGPSGTWGFTGVDAAVDWGRRSPLVVAPTLGLRGVPLDVPTDLLLALPIRVGSAGEATQWGLAARLVIEFDLVDTDDEADD